MLNPNSRRQPLASRMHSVVKFTHPIGISNFGNKFQGYYFNDSLHEGILLDFLTVHEISKASLSKLTKTQVIYPTSIELMIEQVEAIIAHAELFFTVKSYLYQGLNQFLILCRNNKSILRTQLHLDKMFIPKFLFSIDNRINK